MRKRWCRKQLNSRQRVASVMYMLRFYSPREAAWFLLDSLKSSSWAVTSDPNIITGLGGFRVSMPSLLLDLSFGLNFTSVLRVAFFIAPTIWNSFTVALCLIDSLLHFKSQLTIYLFYLANFF